MYVCSTAFIPYSNDCMHMVGFPWDFPPHPSPSSPLQNHQLCNILIIFSFPFSKFWVHVLANPIISKIPSPAFHCNSLHGAVYSTCTCPAHMYMCNAHFLRVRLLQGLILPSLCFFNPIIVSYSCGDLHLGFFQQSRDP